MEAAPRLVRLLVKAKQARRLVIKPVAAKPDRHVCRMARLAFLAPDITEAIFEGRQTSSLSSRTLLKMGQLPLDWAEQRRSWGSESRRHHTMEPHSAQLVAAFQVQSMEWNDQSGNSSP